MKLIYSELKKLLPDLNKDPQILRDDLTMIGHFTNFYEIIENEVVFDLDIKVNRGDCLGYYGLARDLSVYYNIKLVTPTLIERHCEESSTKQSLPITVSSPDVLRLQAIKVSNIKNLTSPDWLKKVLKLHQINSINTLVDLTNYIMLVWGIPNHAFDTAKTTDSLLWENNSKSTTFTTLDGTKLNIKKDCLLITNHQLPLSLSFIGGQNSGITSATADSIIEMAIYNPARVRIDWRSLKTNTEAAIRLEKNLDPDTIPQAFKHLIDLIIQTTGASVASNVFDYYPKPITPPSIDFDFRQPSLVSGIEIPQDFCLDVLARLGCIIKGSTVTPPSIRPDIEAQEDLVEEVVRFWGYHKIPASQPLATANYPDITPKIMYLIDEIKDKLVTIGYDEVLTWPLVENAFDSHSIATQNSINTDYPYLRGSLIPSLQKQVDQYQRLKLVNLQIFEIGKIYFYDPSGIPQESFCLGLYNSDLDQLKKDVDKLGLSVKVGGNYIQIPLDNLPTRDNYSANSTSNTAIELTSQIITLDANVNYDSKQEPLVLIKEYSQKIDASILWQIVITDVYHDELTKKYRYTFRVSYFNCDDKTAKSVHAKSFNLISS